ncbi:MAG: hypothetical protein ACP5DQ_08580 [Bacteroidales bacterium]
MANFWNSTLMSNSCISCGGSGVYFYINWDKNIMPCVFVPYYHENITMLYNSGKFLTHAMFSPLIIKGMAWQKNLLGDKNNPGNLLTPCFYRDHYKIFYENAQQILMLPENEKADETFHSREYHDFMLQFDNKLEEMASLLFGTN